MTERDLLCYQCCPYVDLTKEINKDLEEQIKNNILINQYALIEGNGEELKRSFGAKDIHNQLLKAKKEIIKVKNEKEVVKIKLHAFDKDFLKDIKGFCFMKKLNHSKNLINFISRKTIQKFLKNCS